LVPEKKWIYQDVSIVSCKDEDPPGCFYLILQRLGYSWLLLLVLAKLRVFWLFILVLAKLRILLTYLSVPTKLRILLTVSISSAKSIILLAVPKKVLAKMRIFLTICIGFCINEDPPSCF
jgi:magnesium-transporting ATPase (P-type)